MKRRCRLCSGGDWADAGSVDPEEPHLRQALGDGLASYLRWHQTPEDGPGLFLWEAFVSGGAKTAGGEILGDEVMAAALIDRLLHHCHIVNIRGNSYRMRHHTELSKVLHSPPAEPSLSHPKRKRAKAKEKKTN